MMLDRDESALHAVELSLRGTALLDTPDTILADLRDTEAIREIFATRRPQVVFHAAALKHLPLLEQYPGEAVKTNILGTLAVLGAAQGVERFVNISTDKAANPCSVLGYSKRIAERLTAHAARSGDGTFLNVRFGNVLGSRGSVLTTFTAQAAAGGPITVTHPDVTRYFMTVQEAVQLVIQAAAVGRGGEALILEMGKPVRIAEVARQIADLAPDPVEITYTGLRPGEKLHEELFGPGEHDIRPLHPLISHVDVPPLDPAQVQILDPYAHPTDLVAELVRLCHPSPQPLTAAAAQVPYLAFTDAVHPAEQEVRSA
jgi:FlaA1/EpsC-like NDP-sugar epimerase